MVLAAHPFLATTDLNWHKRARWKAAAPAVDVSVRRGLDERSGRSAGNNVSLSALDDHIIVGPDGRNVTRTSGRTIDYGVALTWKLDDLVFNTQELAVSDQQEQVYRLRESILLDVTRLYFERLRLLAQAAAVSAD